MEISDLIITDRYNLPQEEYMGILKVIDKVMQSHSSPRTNYNTNIKVIRNDVMVQYSFESVCTIVNEECHGNLIVEYHKATRQGLIGFYSYWQIVRYEKSKELGAILKEIFIP